MMRDILRQPRQSGRRQEGIALMARKTTIRPVDAIDYTALPVDGADALAIDVDAMVDAMAVAPAIEPVALPAAPAAPAAPTVPAGWQIIEEANAADAADETYSLVITGSHESLITAGMYAAAIAKRAGVQVCVVDAAGQPIKCYDPPAKRGAGGRGAAGGVAGPRGADWSSKSGQAVTLMMRDDGATMDEMREITGWTFGEKYVKQLRRSFGCEIWTVPATARTKKTWRAKPVTVVQTESDDSDLDVDAAAELDLAAD